MKNINIGDTVRCIVTKIEGIVIFRHDYLYGISRIAIQPSGSFEGKAHEAIHMDIPQAELVSKETVDREGMEANEVIKLGDRGKDKISGFEGICTSRAEWLYACTKVYLTPQKLQQKKYKPEAGEWFDEPQIDLVREEVIERKSQGTGGFDKPIFSHSPSAGFFNNSRSDMDKYIYLLYYMDMDNEWQVGSAHESRESAQKRLEIMGKENGYEIEEMNSYYEISERFKVQE